MRQSIFALVLLMFALPALAAVEDSAAEKLRGRLNTMTTLSGDFTQTLRDEGGAVLETSQGTFVLQRPGRFYWHTLEPFEQLLVSDQQSLWLYDPDLEQVTVRPVTEEVRKTPAMLLAQEVGTLTQNFTVVQGMGDSTQIFTLTPKVEDKLFTRLELVFGGDTLSAIHLFDGLGQHTEFALTNTRKNKVVDESLFTFTPPEGVDLLIE